MIKVIESDGEYILEQLNSNAVNKLSSSVVIESNDDNAVCTFGLKDSDGNFKAYANGVIDDDNIIWHNTGVVLMVSVSGIITNPVKIRY